MDEKLANMSATQREIEFAHLISKALLSLNNMPAHHFDCEYERERTGLHSPSKRSCEHAKNEGEQG